MPRRGPGELTETVYVDNIKFYNDSGHTVGLWFPLNGIHELRRFDLTESLRTGKTVLEIFKLGLDGSTWLSDAVPMPDSRLLVYLSGRERKSISRFILSQDGKTSVTDPMERLNRAEVTVYDEEVGRGQGGVRFVSLSLNTLGTFNGYCASRDLVIESARELNTICIYSPDGSFARTVCTFGDTVDDIKAVQGMDRGRTSMRLKMYDDFFAVVHFFRDEGRKYVRLFSYDGRPLAQIEIPVDVFSFDFDTRTGTFYTMDQKTEVILRHDVSALLESIRKLPESGMTASGQ